MRIKYSIGTRLKRNMRHWQLLLLLLPAFVYIVIFNYWPMVGLQIAFKDYSPTLGFWNSHYKGLLYFKRFITYPFFWQIVKNTLVLSGYTLVAGFPFPIIIALLLNEVRSTVFKKTVQMVVFLPHFISMVAMCGMVILFMDRSAGLFNALREFLGKERIALLSEGPLFKHIYVWSGIWQESGYASVIYIAALSSVDSNLIEAAKIDGAGRARIMYHIDFQCLKPIAITQLILKVGQLLTVGFQKVLLLQNDLNMEYSDVISTYVYRVGLAGAQFSYTTAIGLVNNVTNLILLLSVNMLARRYSETSI